MFRLLFFGQNEFFVPVFRTSIAVIENVWEDDGFPHAVCNPCHYRVEAMWIQASVVNPSHLSKRRHPLSPFTSSSPAANDQNCSFFDKSMKLCQITHIPVTDIFRYGASLNKLP